MQWFLFILLSLFVVNGVRRMAKDGARDAKVKPFSENAASKPAPKVEVQETVQCPQCNAFVTKGSLACDRADCLQGKNNV